MQRCIGTKLINAKPMTRREYNDFRGWQLPSGENGDDAGYLVEYVDGGKANTLEYAGYVSWSPKEVFDKAYHSTTEGMTFGDGLPLLFRCTPFGYHSTTEGMTFGDAIVCLKNGCKVAREGWNGKGMWLILVNGTEVAKLKEGSPYQVALKQDECEILPHIDMWTINASGRRAMLPGWVASQSDMLAEDWVTVS